jgi:hypothetical protein
MSILSELEFYEQLKTVGQTYATDIKNDNPELDVGHECYVRDIDGKLVGYIYMGEVGEWAFIDKEAVEGPAAFDTCDEDVQLWDAPEYLERVKALSPYKGW